METQMSLVSHGPGAVLCSALCLCPVRRGWAVPVAPPVNVQPVHVRADLERL